MLRDIRTFADANVAVRELHDRVERLLNSNFDMRGRRVTNAQGSIDDTDYVIRRELVVAVEDLKTQIRALTEKVYTLEKQIP